MYYPLGRVVGVSPVVVPGFVPFQGFVPLLYTQEINTKEFNFIQKPTDGEKNYTSPIRQSKKGLRNKYNLL